MEIAEKEGGDPRETIEELTGQCFDDLLKGKS